MATAMPESDDPGQHPPVDTLIDELISDILAGAGAGRPAKSEGQSPSSQAGLFATVRSTMAAAGGDTPLLERFLLAEVFAGLLADAIAPALADVLAPRIMRALAPTGARRSTTPPDTRLNPSERSRKASAR